MVQAILGIMGTQSLPHLGALSVRLSEGSLVLMAVCSVRSNCVLLLVSCRCEYNRLHSRACVHC